MVPGDVPGDGQVGDKSISDVSDTEACAELCIATDGLPFYVEEPGAVPDDKLPCKSYEYL